jgi:hypothetical protein
MPIIGSEPDLSWLADAPLFIDGRQIGTFYDALVPREYKAVQLQLSAGQTKQLERSAGGSVTAGVSTLFPWLKISGAADAHRTTSHGSKEDQSITLEPVESPSMRLVQLTLHYLTNQPRRIRVVTHGTEVPGDKDISASPRMLTFIDVPPRTMFLPQAAELDHGRVVTFFDALAEKLQQDPDSPRPPYPEDTTTGEGMRKRRAYWKWYTERWNPDEVVKAVEEVIRDGGRLRWFDYKMTFATGEELNLHADAYGDYDTGVFAYNLIRRGWRYGLRIVGSLKSQPALNVLAIYEK